MNEMRNEVDGRLERGEDDKIGMRIIRRIDGEEERGE